MKPHLAGCVVACALLAGGRSASATTALVGASNATELRVAYAESGEWTTVWSSFRLEGGAGPVGVVVPLPEGAFVDQSSDAWFEALEVATAPRVLPPEGLSPYCPGESGPGNPFEVSASIEPTESLLPQTLALMDDAAGVASWAAAQGLSVDAGLASKLAGTGAVRFLVVRFQAPAGAASTPTLRISAPKGLPVLPFSITRAGASNVRVTAWLFGEGRASFTGTTAASVPGNAIVWNAKTGRSSYVEYRDELLAGDPDRDALESSGHDALADSTPIPGGAAAIEAVAATYFERAAAYGNGLPEAGACVAAAKGALDADGVVGPVCPRGDLAALAGACVGASPGVNELDPAAFFCGPGADDLALVVAGAVAADTWVTRHTLVIAAGATGKDRGVFDGPAPEKLPIVQAAGVDIGDCFGGAGGGGTTSSSGSGASGGSTSTSSGSGGTTTGSGSGNSGNWGSGSGNSGSWGGSGGDESDPSVYVDTSGCACSGPIDTGDTYETYDSGGDDCDGGSSSGSSGDDCDSGSSAGSSGDDCDSGSSAGSSGDDCDSGTTGGGDDCSGDAGSSDSCGGDSASSDCSVSRGSPNVRRRVLPKLSVMTLALTGLLLPLRRRGTRKRREQE